MSAPTYYDDKDAKTEGAAVTTVVTSPEGSDYGIESKERVHVDGRRRESHSIPLSCRSALLMSGMVP